MRNTLCVVMLALTIAGCQATDTNPKWDPQAEYPPWAYDAPFYYRPSEDLPVAEVRGDGIPVYYTASRQFFIRHANGNQPPGTPRLAVWYSADAGEHWTRAGYFGVEQTHFLFEADTDGPHWIRFVGPAQGIVQTPPGAPHRIYVVDTEPAQIEMSITPPPVTRDKDGNDIRRTFTVDEEITVRWDVRDPNLAVDKVCLSTAFGSFPSNVVWNKFPLPMPPVGSIKVPIPPPAGQPGPSGEGVGMRIRIEAVDKAGNLKFEFSELLRVAATGPPDQAAPLLRPAKPWALINQAGGPAGKRPGWPEPATLIRGGTSRLLPWLPDTVKNYTHVVLQFSANNGRSWRTVADNLKAGQPVKWSVPPIDSKLCRLRVLAVKGPEHRLMLAQSMPFTVHTAPAEILIGPKVVGPEPREK